MVRPFGVICNMYLNRKGQLPAKGMVQPSEEAFSYRDEKPSQACLTVAPSGVLMDELRAVSATHVLQRLLDVSTSGGRLNSRA